MGGGLTSPRSSLPSNAAVQPHVGCALGQLPRAGLQADRQKLQTWSATSSAGEGTAEWSSPLAWVAQGFGGEYVAEYIRATGMDGEFNVGEYWADLK